MFKKIKEFISLFAQGVNYAGALNMNGGQMSSLEVIRVVQ